ncbi:protein FAM177A1-like [Babylonia areolata]|uniref:protein FAM177A1-like n=1 Tax=Babylonia areolata TaxID=304850 RepID=UPI003FD339D5
MATTESEGTQANQPPAEPTTHGGMTSQGAPFTSVSLGDGDAPSEKKKKVPRRILHFSDGILEEYSTDEEEEDVPDQPLVDPKTLKWMPWFWYYVSTAAYRTWSVADFCGEKLAWWFGITSPKYQSAIDEYYRRKEEEEKEKAEEERRLSRATLTTELSASSIDMQVVQEENVMVGNTLEKY